ILSRALPPASVCTLSLHDALPIYGGTAQYFAHHRHLICHCHGTGFDVWFHEDLVEYCAAWDFHSLYRRLPWHSNSGLGVLLLFRSEEHTSALQSRFEIVCRLLLDR